jgi:hypothetical protein
LFDNIELFYNRRRHHATLDYTSSMKLAANWVSAQHKKKLAT